MAETLKSAAYSSKDNFRIEAVYTVQPETFDGQPVGDPYDELRYLRRDRNGPEMAAIEAALTPDAYVAPVVVPDRVTAYQARVALHRAGLLPAVVALMTDPATDEEAKIAWEYATVFERESPFVLSLAPGLGMSDTDIDNLFILAESIG